MRFVLCFRYGVLYHKTLGIPDFVPTPAPEYVLTAVIPSDLFLAPIGTPVGKLRFFSSVFLTRKCRPKSFGRYFPIEVGPFCL